MCLCTQRSTIVRVFYLSETVDVVSWLYVSAGSFFIPVDEIWMMIKDYAEGWGSEDSERDKNVHRCDVKARGTRASNTVTLP